MKIRPTQCEGRILITASAFMYNSSMNTHRTRFWLAITAVTIVVINTIASYLHWYYFVWWFDMPMHFLGGVFTALICITFGFRFFRCHYEGNRTRAILYIIGSVILVGILWELYELIVQIVSGAILVTGLDSISDLFFDLSGGMTALLLFMDKSETRV